MSKIVDDNIPYKRSEVIVSFVTHKKWKALLIKERITFKRLTLLALLYYGHRQEPLNIEEFNKAKPDPIAITSKRCRICYPVEVEDYFTEIAQKHRIAKHLVFYYYINKYVNWQSSGKIEELPLTVNNVRD